MLFLDSPFMAKELICRITLPSGEVWSEDSRENGSYVLDWKRSARFRISANGREILTQPHPQALSISVEILRRLAQTYAESLHGKESLHATGLVRGGKAIALLGTSGEGKSTMAAAFLKRGWELLSDDALPLIFRKDQVFVRSHAPHLKLSRLAAGAAAQKNRIFTFDPNLEKWILRFPDKGGLYPLKAFFLLSRRDCNKPFRLKRLKDSKAAVILQASFYNEILRPRRVIHRQFHLALRLAQDVPVWTVIYPTGFHRLSKAAQAIEAVLL